MRKKFEVPLDGPKRDRAVEAVKHEIKKYVAREKRKTLPEGQARWFFDCKIGKDEADLRPVKLSEINGAVDSILKDGVTAFFILIEVAGPKNPA